jgi:hypothetical protein
MLCCALCIIIFELAHLRTCALQRQIYSGCLPSYFARAINSGNNKNVAILKLRLCHYFSNCIVAYTSGVQWYFITILNFPSKWRSTLRRWWEHSLNSRVIFILSLRGFCRVSFLTQLKVVVVQYYKLHSFWNATCFMKRKKVFSWFSLQTKWKIQHDHLWCAHIDCKIAAIE